MSTPPPPPPPGSRPPGGPPPFGHQPPFPGQPPSVQPPFPAPPPGYSGTHDGGRAPGTNGLAVASMVLGIIGTLLCFLWIPSILATVFGGVSLKQIARTGQGGRGMAIAGLVLGIVGLALAVLVLAAGDVDWNLDDDS